MNKLIQMLAVLTTGLLFVVSVQAADSCVIVPDENGMVFVKLILHHKEPTKPKYTRGVSLKVVDDLTEDQKTETIGGIVVHPRYQSTISAIPGITVKHGPAVYYNGNRFITFTAQSDGPVVVYINGCPFRQARFLGFSRKIRFVERRLVEPKTVVSAIE